jgi:NurA domain
MPITFLDPENVAIKKLVDLCGPASQPNAGGLLVTPPLEKLVEEHQKAEPEYVEPEDLPAPIISSTIQAYPFTSSQRIMSDFIIAVDSGVITLGQATGGGIAFAIRGAAVCYAGKDLLILRYSTGALLITPQNKSEVFRYIGTRLGNPDLYVRKIGSNYVAPLLETSNQITDRCRNFVERMIQEESLALLAANKGGLLLIDGALAISYDTPRIYLNEMLKCARDRAVDVCAISKRSRISIGGIPIDSLFDQYPTFVGYAPLLHALDTEHQAYEGVKTRALEDITAGTEIYAARFGFGPPGVTFRVDVSKSWGSNDQDVINDVYNKCQIYGGYPKPLIDAHHYSTFLGGDAMTLLADLAVRANLRMKEEPSMGVLFQPFGAFGK